MESEHLTGGCKERILEAAGEIFAECGFRGSTVRKICERAGVNVAAINYYFGGKEKLYSEVLRHWHDFAIQKYPHLLGLDEDAPPEAQLRAFIRSLLFRLLDKGKPAWFGKLMVREMTEPTPAFELLVKEIVYPRDKILASIVQKIIGAALDEEKLRLFCASIIGQCLYYHHVISVMPHTYPNDVSETDEIEKIADHVTEFSLAGLKYLQRDDDKAGRESQMKN